MTAYFRLYKDPDLRKKGIKLPRIDAQPDLDLPWLIGARFNADPPVPIHCTMEDVAATDWPDAFLSETIPLFSERLIHCLTQVGVTNLDLYEARLTQASGEPAPRRYFAVNIVGLLSAVDQQASRTHPLTAVPMLEFEHLAIDEKAAQGLHLFRLAENALFIVVDQAVKDAIDAAGLIDVMALSFDHRSAY